jgi:GT2 family glycosyltransferase
MLRECLVALKAQTFRDFRIYVADNGSTDGTREMLATDFPETQLVALETNRGFTGAVNAGLRAGREPLVALLNNDMLVEPSWLGALVGRAQEHSEESIWACVTVWVHRPDLIESAGLALFHDGTPAILHRTESLASLPETPVRVPGASGGAALYRRAVFEQIGLFDERFFCYGEDTDLAMRAHLSGFVCVLVPAARALHYHMATSSRIPIRSACWQYRNLVLGLVKNLPAGFLLKHMPRFLLTGLRPLLTRPWTGLGWALQWTKLEILWLLPHALRERRRIRGHVTLHDPTMGGFLVEGRSRPTAEMRPP